MAKKMMKMGKGESMREDRMEGRTGKMAMKPEPKGEAKKDNPFGSKRAKPFGKGKK